MMDPTTAVVLIGVGSGMVGYALTNERRQAGLSTRLARMETKLDLIMAEFHLQMKAEGGERET
jgi:hypothetical protein